MILRQNLPRYGSKRLTTRVFSNQGVAIVEALMASVILVIALIGFLKVAISTTNLGGKNTKTATAISLINDKYESFILGDYSNIVPGPPDEAGIDIDSQGTIISGVFTRAVTTSQLADGTSTAIAQNVTITITWPGGTVSQTSIFMRR